MDKEMSNWIVMSKMKMMGVSKSKLDHEQFSQFPIMISFLFEYY